MFVALPVREREKVEAAGGSASKLANVWTARVHFNFNINPSENYDSREYQSYGLALGDSSRREVTELVKKLIKEKSKK